MDILETSDLTQEDIDMIMKTSRDFIESWYTADPDRMENSFHPDAIKRSVVYDEDQKKWEVSQIRTPKDMARFTRDGGESDLPASSKTLELELIGAHRRTAVVKVISHSFVDFIQLGKFDNGWLIVNDLWEKKFD